LSVEQLFKKLINEITLAQKSLNDKIL